MSDRAPVPGATVRAGGRGDKDHDNLIGSSRIRVDLRQRFGQNAIGERAPRIDASIADLFSVPSPLRHIIATTMKGA